MCLPSLLCPTHTHTHTHTHEHTHLSAHHQVQSQVLRARRLGLGPSSNLNPVAPEHRGAQLELRGPLGGSGCLDAGSWGSDHLLSWEVVPPTGPSARESSGAPRAAGHLKPVRDSFAYKITMRSHPAFPEGSRE